MLDKGAHDRGRAFGAERKEAAASVHELVHFFGDHVRRVPRAAAKYLHVLETWAHDEAEPSAACPLGESSYELAPARALRSEDVLGPLGGLESGHRPAGAVAPPLP